MSISEPSITKVLSDQQAGRKYVEAVSQSSGAPTGLDYLKVGLGLAGHGLLTTYIVKSGSGVIVPSLGLLDPLLTMVGLVGGVWLAMLVARNYAVISGLDSGDYFRAYQGPQPPDWVERPARTFNNLMQLPTLFYLMVLLTFSLSIAADQAQVGLAWLFVGTRYVHALVYMGWNHLPARFGCYVAGMVTLAVLWFRFAASAGGLS